MVTMGMELSQRADGNSLDAAAGAAEGGCMKTVTVEQFKSFRPCWLETAKGRERFARISAIRNEWTRTGCVL